VQGAEPNIRVDLKDAIVAPLEAARTSKRHAFEIVCAEGGASAPAESSAAVATEEDPRVRLAFAGDSREDMEGWLVFLAAGAVPSTWPGGVGVDKRPAPFLYSRVERAAQIASQRVMRDGKSKAEADEAARSTERSLSPVERLPVLKSVPIWQQRALLLRKLRLCSVCFESTASTLGEEGADGEPRVSAAVAGSGIPPSAITLEARDIKRQTLLELVDFCDSSRTAFNDYRVLEDTFSMLRCNLIRALPKPAAPTQGDPDEEEEPFMDPQWSHLSVAYELLLHLVSLDWIELPLKKKVIDPSFVRGLLQLFDSEDMRERDYLKTITHRIYSKLTQRRALIRRVICNIFFEFVYETQEHNGVAEMLEILASIINGFAVPIKDEHKVMLARALVPLHKPACVMQYHPQLSYCMALYVAKDHTLTREIIPGLLRYWPFGNSQKQIMYLNELEDVFEYVREDDLPFFRRQLGQRLRKVLGGFHFQVAERALCLWHSERFAVLMLEGAETRQEILPQIFPVLHANANRHWHESVRQLSAHILDQYAETDPDLYHRCLSAIPPDAEEDDGGGLGKFDKQIISSRKGE
jgi:serine/threonine-protein phosphatase 2A regulatory subunit B'